MTKEDLNRIYGDPERQKPITPPNLLAAAHLIREHCSSIPLSACKKCIFLEGDDDCLLFEQAPSDWLLSPAEHRTADWIDKQHFQGRGLYTDTDMKEEDKLGQAET